MRQIELKVNDAADRRTLAGILVDAGCSVRVERRAVETVNKRKVTETWVIITMEEVKG